MSASEHRQAEIAVLILKGAIAGLPQERQDHIKNIAEAIRALVVGEDGIVALSLVGAEVQLANGNTTG